MIASRPVSRMWQAVRKRPIMSFETSWGISATLTIWPSTRMRRTVWLSLGSTWMSVARDRAASRRLSLAATAPGVLPCSAVDAWPRASTTVIRW